jgi:hypothetical protein
MAAPGAIDDPFGNAGSPQPTVPVMPPANVPGPMAAAGSGAGMAAGAGPASPGDAGELFGAVDFVPQCDTEAPSALMSSDACRYPLPMDLDPSTTQVAVLTAGMPALLERHFDAFGCLVGDGYFVDATGMPPAIVLCPATCAGLAMDAQLVVIEGCPP